MSDFDLAFVIVVLGGSCAYAVGLGLLIWFSWRRAERRFRAWDEREKS